jgi:hypothetical protein
MKLSPKKNWIILKEGLTDLSRNKKYTKVVKELFELGKLEEIGLKVDDDLNMYVGINLNPELLVYSDTSQEPAELRLISERLGKYTDFLTKEGIIDYIKVDYDRVKTIDYYGYILKISYDFKKYSRSRFISSIFYFIFLISTSILLITLGLVWLL